jgi:hypothetical protein
MPLLRPIPFGVPGRHRGRDRHRQSDLGFLCGSPTTVAAELAAIIDPERAGLYGPALPKAGNAVRWGVAKW